MIGAIIGDIAGSSYEFNNTSDYNFPLFDASKDFTDDTICTVAIADAILHKSDYESSMRKWCRRFPHPMGEYGNYFFKWVMSPNPLPYNSYGNGSAMRVSPVAWLFDNEQDVREQAKLSAAITHNHPEGVKGAVTIALAIFRMRKDITRSSSIFEKIAEEMYGEGAFSNLPPKGYFDVTCQGCVPLSLHIAASAESFEDAVRRAVVYGGDTDTVGAIVGSLAEARFGVPEKMITAAKNYLPEEILEIISEFETQKADLI